MAISEEDQKFIESGLGGTGNGSGGSGASDTPQCYDDVTCPPNYICVTGNCVAGCTSAADCPAGYVCFNGRCRLADVPTPTKCSPPGEFIRCSGYDGLGIFAGGESPPGQPCNTFTAPSSQCGGTACPPVGTFIRCTELRTELGVIGEFSNGLQNGVCSSYTAIAEQCSTVYCNMTDVTAQCANILDDTWEGTASRTVNVLVNGQPTPADCTVFPGIPTAWDTSECTKKVGVTPKCPPQGEFKQCSGTTGVYYTGAINAVTKECLTVNQLNDSQCIKISCPPNGEFLRCEDGYTSGGTKPTNAVFSDGGLFGVCGEYRGNLAQCEITRTCDRLPPYFDRCDGTTGIYLNGCNNDTDNPPERRANDLACIVVVPTPTPTPTPTSTLTQGDPAPTPPPPPTPTPTPEPPPVVFVPTPTWRDCVSGNLNDGIAPSAYREILYTGAGGGTCWEPSTIIGFSPNLNEALLFSYERGSVSVPQPKSVTVTNPSYGVAYRITLTTNPDVKLGIGDKSGAGALSFTVEPRKNVVFSVNVTPQLLDKLGDGSSDLDMKVEIQTV